MPFDRVKNQRKNFCFITYDNENVVFDLLKTPKQVINGKEVDVKKATPKPESFGPPAMRGARGGPGGMRGAPRGRGGIILGHFFFLKNKFFLKFHHFSRKDGADGEVKEDTQLEDMELVTREDTAAATEVATGTAKVLPLN